MSPKPVLQLGALFVALFSANASYAQDAACHPDDEQVNDGKSWRVASMDEHYRVLEAVKEGDVNLLKAYLRGQVSLAEWSPTD